MTDVLLSDKEREALQCFVLFVRAHPELGDGDPMMVEAFAAYMSEARTQDAQRERWHKVVDDAQLREAEGHT
jgi:hypothetical protein